MLIQILSSDPEVLADLHASARSDGIEVSEPEAIADVAALNLDLAAADFSHVWDVLVSVGHLAGAMQVVQLVVDLLRRRRESGVMTTVETVIGGATITFAGDMTPSEAAERLNEFRALAGAAEPT